MSSQSTQQNQHNNSLESSLTAPHDRTSNMAQTAQQGVVLSESQVQSALSENVDQSIIDKFPKVEKYFADPIFNNQMYCLHSFVPSKGATPDDQGIFGFMKCRGSCQTQQEASQRAEWIIRNVDSYHKIQTCYSGRPFPVCVDTQKYVKETIDVDIRKKIQDTLSEDVKAKREEEKREMEDIKEREKKLLDESKEDYVHDPLEKYTVLRVKKANLEWTYKKTLEKMDEMKRNILKVRNEIKEMDDTDSSYMDQYYEKYMEARRVSGLDDEKLNTEDNFTKYLCEDLDIGF